MFLSKSTCCVKRSYAPAYVFLTIQCHSALGLNEKGSAQICSATDLSLPDDSVACIVTDPPYYNAVPYADLSQFFYVWHRRNFLSPSRLGFEQPETPKIAELCEMAGWDSERYPEKTGKWFENQMTLAMKESCRVLQHDGIIVVVFAHKSTSGWEAMLQAMIDAGWIVVASWPIDTERGARLRAMNSAALGSSVHIACRPRIGEPVGDWRDVLGELPKRIHAWMPRLAKEGVVGADAIFASLGPALEIFSQYSKVEKANGDVVPLREYLELVWGAISKEALAMIFHGADAAGLEEDARLTSIWLWTLSTGGTPTTATEEETEEESEGDEDEESSVTSKATKGFSLEYDAARKIAQGLGIHLEQLGEVVEIKGSTARLRAVEERTNYLFKKPMDKLDDGPSLSKKELQKQVKAKQYSGSLFDGLKEPIPEEKFDLATNKRVVFTPGATVLDRVHQCMLLFAAGRSDALKRFLVDEGHGKDAKLWKLAQSLSALYPSGSSEKRWVNGVLARKKGLGF